MKKVSLVLSKYFQQNKIFDENLAGSSFFKTLKNKLLENKVEISTNDIINPNHADLVIYLDIVRKVRKNSLLILSESEVVIPWNYKINNHKKFKKIFTWNKDLIDGNKYIKYYLSYDFKPFKKEINFDKKKLICCISANKYSSHSNELYSKRIEILKFFQKNQPHKMDLYGRGWNTQFKHPLIYSIIKRFSLIKGFGLFTRLLISFISKFGFERLFFENYCNYKGVIEDKNLLLEDYKFNLCFENASNISTYITEKIFDCFNSGCVPVYLGSEDINKYIPKNTFIDFRQFNSNSEFYDYLNKMSKKTYLNYIENAKKFMESTCSEIFSADYNSNIFLKHIISQIS